MESIVSDSAGIGMIAVKKGAEYATRDLFAR